MKTPRRIAVSLGAALALPLALAASLSLAPVQPAAAAELTVIMEEVPDYDIVAKLAKRFEAENPGIKITFDAMPYDAMRDKILTSFLAPTSNYDIIIIDNPWMDEFGRAGYLEPLDAMIAATPGYAYDDFVGPLRRIGEVDGKTYGVPYYNYALGLIVRQDIFDAKGLKVPTTLEGYVSTVKRLTSGGFYGAAMQPQRGYKIFEEWKNWLYAAGGDLMDASGNVTINSPEAVKALEMYIDAYKNAAPPGSLNWGFDEALRSVSSGGAATMLSYNWMLPTLNDPNGPSGKLAGKFALYEVPGGKAVLGAWHWAIPHNASDKADAWKFISWLTSKSVDKERVIMGGAPIRTSVITDREVWAKGAGKAYYTTVLGILDDAEPLAGGAHAEELIEIVGTELSAAVAGQKTPKEALDDAAKRVAAANK